MQRLELPFIGPKHEFAETLSLTNIPGLVSGKGARKHLLLG
jgi:hypothetical protein